MKPEITIKSAPIGPATCVTGFVGTNEVISLSNTVGDKWRVTGSACLPGDLDLAAQYLECVQRSFARAREHGAPIGTPR